MPSDPTIGIWKWIALKRYRFDVWAHDIRTPVRWGDPLYGRSREQRNQTINLILDRWEAKAPKPESYGLPQDTAPTKGAAMMRAKKAIEQ